MAYAKRYAGGFVDGSGGGTPEDSVFLNAVESALLKLFGVDPSADGQSLIWVAANGRYEPKLIKNANIDPAAAIDKTKLGPLGIVNADVAAGAAIDGSKIAGGFPISKFNGYPNAIAKLLKGDGSWGGPFLVSAQRTSNVTGVAATTFAAAGSILSVDQTFVADGTSTYLAVVFAANWFNTTAGASNFLGMSLVSGTEYQRIGSFISATASATSPLVCVSPFSPAAGTYTGVNIRLYVSAGTGAITATPAGGGANVAGPLFFGILAV